MTDLLPDQSATAPAPGDIVTCDRCSGRGWVYYETGKRRPRDLERGDCRVCRGTGRRPVETDSGPWTIYLRNGTNDPTLMNVNPRLYTPVEVVPSIQRDAWREEAELLALALLKADPSNMALAAYEAFRAGFDEKRAS